MTLRKEGTVKRRLGATQGKSPTGRLHKKGTKPKATCYCNGYRTFHKKAKVKGGNPGHRIGVRGCAYA